MVYVDPSLACGAQPRAARSASAAPFQTPAGEDTFMVVEKWASLDALKAHAAAPHMATFGVATKDMIADRKVYILQNV